MSTDDTTPASAPGTIPLPTDEQVDRLAVIIATAIGCEGGGLPGDECQPEPSDYHAATAALAHGYSASTPAPVAVPGGEFPQVRGYCPSCGCESLFLAAGGYVTCSWIECSDPIAPNEALEHRPEPVVAPLPSEAVDAALEASRETPTQVAVRSPETWMRGILAAALPHLLPEEREPAKAEPARLRIEAGWLVREEDDCTCNGGDVASSGAHEPGCGLIPELHLSTLPGWPTIPEDDEDTVRAALAELVRLKDGPRDDAYRAEKDAAWQAARDALDGAR